MKWKIFLFFRQRQLLYLITVNDFSSPLNFSLFQRFPSLKRKPFTKSLIFLQKSKKNFWTALINQNLFCSFLNRLFYREYRQVYSLSEPSKCSHLVKLTCHVGSIRRRQVMKRETMSQFPLLFPAKKSKKVKDSHDNQIVTKYNKGKNIVLT